MLVLDPVGVVFVVLPVVAMFLLLTGVSSRRTVLPSAANETALQPNRTDIHRTLTRLDSTLTAHHNKDEGHRDSFLSHEAE